MGWSVGSAGVQVGIADLLAALREIPRAFPGCRTRTGASSASRRQIVGNNGLLDSEMQTKGLPDMMTLDL